MLCCSCLYRNLFIIMYWLKINQRIQFTVLSLIYKVLMSNQPSYLPSLLTVQNSRSIRSSSVVTLIRPPNPSRLMMSNRSFYHSVNASWNSLPAELRMLSANTTSSTSLFALSASQFLKKLETFIFRRSYPP
jgi:hypothetical protein